MKTNFTLLAAMLAGWLPAINVLAQGSLTPPGVPQPTMKTLTQVEPRIPIDATNTPGQSDCVHSIAAAGSYYLTGNITGESGKNGIRVDADNVSIDLNGFTMTGLGPVDSQNAIMVSASLKQITIQNGALRNWQSGIAASASTELRFERLLVSGGHTGIAAGPGSIVKDCMVTDATLFGFTCGSGSIIGDSVARDSAGGGFSAGDNVRLVNCAATTTTNGPFGFPGIAAGQSSVLSGCVARGFRGTGISLGNYGVISDCVAVANGMVTANSGMVTGEGTVMERCTAIANSSSGIVVGAGSTVQSCTVRSNTVHGLLTTVATAIRNCTASGNGQDGIRVETACTVTGNTCDNNGVSSIAAGIHAISADNRIAENNVTANDRGIHVGSPGNLISRNSASGNTTANYDVVVGNFMGTIVTSEGALNSATNSSNINIAF
jgi:parallel beta-helix repeat protein